MRFKKVINPCEKEVFVQPPPEEELNENKFIKKFQFKTNEAAAPKMKFSVIKKTKSEQL